MIGVVLCRMYESSTSAVLMDGADQSAQCTVPIQSVIEN